MRPRRIEGGILDTLGRDIRYAVRSMLKQPVFTAIAMLTLALGIGANTTIFSVINGLILTLQDWRRANQSFEDIAGYKKNSFDLTDGGEAERIQGMRVTANFFPLLKVHFFRGRNFQPEEDKRGSQPVTIISYEFWQSRFGGNEGILNQQINLNGKSHT